MIFFIFIFVFISFNGIEFHAQKVAHIKHKITFVLKVPTTQVVTVNFL